MLHRQPRFHVLAMQCKIRRQYVCRRCDRKFATENAVWTHGAFKHPAATPAEFSLAIGCRTCDCSFASEPELEHHLLQNSSNQLRRLFGLSTAGRRDAADVTASAADTTNKSDVVVIAAADSSSLAGEQRPAGVRPVCPVCSRKFHNLNSLWTHLAFKHPDYVDLDLKQVELAAAGVLPGDVSAQSVLISTPPSKCSDFDSPVTSTRGLLSQPMNTVISHEEPVTAGTCSHEQELNTAGTCSHEQEPNTARTCFSHEEEPNTAQSIEESLTVSSHQSRQPDNCHTNVGPYSSCSSNSSRHNGCGPESPELDILLMSTRVSNDLLADHVATLEQRVTELQIYFSQILSDMLAEEPSNGISSSLVHISQEEIQSMEVAGEVVIVDETPTKMTTTAPYCGNKSRRRRRAKKMTRVQPSQEGGSEVVGSLDPSSSLDPGSAHRARLRI